MTAHDERTVDPARRGLLRWLGAGVLGLLGAGGCRPGKRRAPDPIEVPLADVPVGGRLRVLHGDLPVELRRSEAGVAARSLMCTHWGCEVRWNREGRKYLCPCHEGVFDENGQVIAGPPPRPLPSYPVVVDGPIVRVGVGG